MNAPCWNRQAEHCEIAAPSDRIPPGKQRQVTTVGDLTHPEEADALLGPTPGDGTDDSTATPRRQSRPVVALVLSSVTAAALGIVRTLIDNGTGYLTVGGRVLDAQESVGLLGLPGTLLPLLAAVTLLFTDVSPSRRGLLGLGSAAMTVGQFLPSATGARSSGAARWTGFPNRRLPLDLSLASTLFGLLLIIVLAAAAVQRERELLFALGCALVSALTVTLGLRSAGAAFRWRDGPDTSVTVGLWLSLFVALGVAAIAAMSGWRQRPLPPSLYGVLAGLVAVGAVLLAG